MCVTVVAPYTAFCLELGGMNYDIMNVKGTKCKVRCSGIPSSSTRSVCEGATVSYTVKARGGSFGCGFAASVGDDGDLLWEIVGDDGPPDR